uniref:Protein kinase domain-containing protein n=1 Tax=Macrostomum lignano TaxID=282301 RepID=A0A1I8J198_9PLAT
DQTGNTAAHLAAQRDHLRLLELLPFNAKWLSNQQGATPLMEASRTGSWRCAKHLLHLLRQKAWNNSRRFGNETREELLGQTDADGQTALDLARRSGYKDMAAEIELELRLSVDRSGFIHGLTESEEAIRAELEQLARSGDAMELRRVVTRSNCDLPDARGFTLPMWAAANKELNDPELWARLLQLADATCAAVSGESCLHRAAGSGSPIAANALMDAGASSNSTAQFGLTPLMVAASAERLSNADAVGWVLLSAGSDWTAIERKGRTALNLATKNPYRSDGLVELLSGYDGKGYFDEPIEPPSWSNKILLGRGGFGDVNEVFTDREVRCVAKTLRFPIQLGDDRHVLSEKVNKAVESERNMCLLWHENIVRFMHIAQQEQITVVIFMELLSGQSLERFLQEKPLEEATTRKFCTQICSALEYMHGRQRPVIHRDINCANIIVLADNVQIKLIDFGLSIKLEESVSHYSASAATPKGTLNFMAPELVAPEGLANP